MKHALVIGDSDGIGLALTRRLIGEGWSVSGISRSELELPDLADSAYTHLTCDVRAEDFRQRLQELDQNHPVDLCVYCAGVGEELDLVALKAGQLANDAATFDVNLNGAVAAMEIIGGAMLRRDSGHFITLSSLADATPSASAPSYAASKAAMSYYFESLGLALPRSSGVAITNVRYGFVDTKMAKSPVRPFMMSVPRAVDVVMRAIQTRPLRVTKPWPMAAIMSVLRWTTQWRIRLR
ncbi:MAG: short-subunit dehydrogenase [Hyphomicrobiaceae bacterium]|jgi:short-subunit dehydrogenase